MASPFPGMDPYLEKHWLDVHGALIAETRRVLNRSLPSGLVARMEERIAVEADDDGELQFGPDVFVYRPAAGPREIATGGSMAIDAPFRLVVDVQPKIERFVRIVNQDGQLVTVVEFISPANKRSPGLDAFQSKRNELLDAGVHVIEIDLVRAGNWQALFRPHVCTHDAMSLYRAAIRTPGYPAAVYLYPIRLQDPLPEIQIPLRPKDPKLMLALQPLIENVYADGRYAATLDYTQTLEPPLSAEDHRFAGERSANK